MATSTSPAASRACCLAGQRAAPGRGPAASTTSAGTRTGRGGRLRSPSQNTTHLGRRRPDAEPATGQPSAAPSSRRRPTRTKPSLLARDLQPGVDIGPAAGQRRRQPPARPRARRRPGRRAGGRGGGRRRRPPRRRPGPAGRRDRVERAQRQERGLGSSRSSARPEPLPCGNAGRSDHRLEPQRPVAAPATSSTSRTARPGERRRSRRRCRTRSLSGRPPSRSRPADQRRRRTPAVVRGQGEHHPQRRRERQARSPARTPAGVWPRPTGTCDAGVPPVDLGQLARQVAGALVRAGAATNAGRTRRRWSFRIVNDPAYPRGRSRCAITVAGTVGSSASIAAIAPRTAVDLRAAGRRADIAAAPPAPAADARWCATSQASPRSRPCSAPRHGAADAPRPSHARRTSPDPSSSTPVDRGSDPNPPTRWEVSRFRPSQMFSIRPPSTRAPFSASVPPCGGQPISIRSNPHPAFFAASQPRSEPRR